MCVSYFRFFLSLFSCFLRFKLPKSFAFAPVYVMFYDYLEKSNVFLESFHQHLSLPLQSEEMKKLMSDPISDSSFWCNVRRLIEKYVLMPESVYSQVNPLSINAFKPDKMVKLLKNILTTSANRMHQMFHDKPAALKPFPK